ncbi:MAG TPA: lysophospholipid acyltransferase family protein [Verrucomicrobiae bacterium]|jgi:lysophospholipid acyltransferase (LPLAT)-like uncharacterized protein|nr:lysophospholipid acyltransferase family protein [Verrucomicrobiae bacterium]
MWLADRMHTTHGSRPPASGVVVPHQPRWYQRLAAWLIYAVVRSVSSTIRYEYRDRTNLLQVDKEQPVVWCIWHNRLALCLEIYQRIQRRVGRQRQMAAMVSASKDGGLLAGVLEKFGVQPVRGSTSRRGRQALLELTTWADRGYDLALTPDGPRGPCYEVQDGVTSVAQVTGLPIIPVTYWLSWKIRLGSWDRFQIPLPFTKCVVDFGVPLRVPREASDEAREEARGRLEAELRAATVD